MVEEAELCGEDFAPQNMKSLSVGEAPNVKVSALLKFAGWNESGEQMTELLLLLQSRLLPGAEKELQFCRFSSSSSSSSSPLKQSL